MNNNIKTYNDLLKYVCKYRNGYDLMQFYVKNPNEVAKAFWDGVLTVLEIEGIIDSETGWNIWNEIID